MTGVQSAFEKIKGSTPGLDEKGGRMKPNSRVKFLVYDLEATGVSVFNDRIVQCFIGLADERGNLVESHEWFINPGVPVGESADIHGYTDEWLQEHGRAPREALAEILDLFREYWKIPWAAFNQNFDMSMLTHEFERHGVIEGFGEKVASAKQNLWDGLVIDRKKDKYRKGPRKLANMAQHYRVPFREEDLHDARADVELTAKVTLAILSKHGVPTTADQQVWYAEWSNGIRDYYTKRGKDASGFTGEWPVRRTRTKEDQ